MKHLFSIALIGFISILCGPAVYGQDQNPVISNVEKSLKIGSARELVKNFESQVELSLSGANGSMQKATAEEKLREFFKNNPVTSFRYIHHGGSGKGGLKYAIGKYQTATSSFRVLIRFKDVSGTLMVYNISFTKE